MKRGGYATPDELVAAALASLDQHERFGDFEPQELKRLLEEGEASGEFLDGAEALAARRRRRAKQNHCEPIWDKLRKLAGSAPGLPPDAAINHDHYLYGTPKQSRTNGETPHR
jgi:Arc/MetJ-type ribon-helix-helix transcriptional regulator